MSAWDWMGSLALLPAGYLLSGWLGRMICGVHLLQIGGAIGFAALLLTLLPSSTRNLTRLPDTSQSLPHEPAEMPGALAARP